MAQCMAHACGVLLGEESVSEQPKLRIVKPRAERKRKPAPPHDFTPCRVVTHDGTFYQCGRGDCQDDTHRVRAALL